MKAMIIIDKPEQVCQNCRLCYEIQNDEYICVAAGEIIPDGEIPNWCLLQILPEKRETSPDWESSYDAGWNDCINAIKKQGG